MKVYPRITGALCANSHPGSYTGQDAFNDMLIVIEREQPCITGQVSASPNSYRGGGGKQPNGKRLQGRTRSDTGGKLHGKL